MQEKKRAAKRVQKKVAPIDNNSQEQSSELVSEKSDDISDLIETLKHKFSKKTVDAQKQLEGEIDQKTKQLCNQVNDAFKGNEIAM